MHIPKQIKRRVRSGGGFIAADPWNGNRQTDFTIEVYKMLAPESPLGTGIKDSWFFGPPMFAIKSEIDGQVRMLPESLVELWRTQRVPAESLPRLLRQMQPSLKTSDYLPTLRGKSIQWLAAGVGLFCLVIVAFTAHNFEPIEVLLLTLTAMLIPLLPMLVMGRRQARCRRQMDWALSHL
jgi:hypothetical protein